MEHYRGKLIRSFFLSPRSFINYSKAEKGSGDLNKVKLLIYYGAFALSQNVGKRDSLK